MPAFTLRDGTRIAYDDLGQGPPLLLVHGYLMGRDLWMYQTIHFRERFRVIVPDLRGHGDSDRTVGSYAPVQHAADLAELITGLDLPPVAVTGWSMGATIVAGLYRSCPAQIRGLALVSGPVRFPIGPDYAFGRTPEAHTRFLAAIRSDYPALVRTFVRSLFHRPVGDATIDWVERTALRVPGWVALDQWEGTGRTDFGDVLPSIQVPTLVLHGRQDARIPWQAAEWTAKRIKGSRLVLWDEVGHTPFIEDQVTFNTALEDWLATCDTGSV